MRLINTSTKMIASFEAGHFDIEKWKIYIDDAVPGARQICMDDMQECVEAGFSWQNDYLPVLDKVFADHETRNRTIREFCNITETLEAKIMEVFHKDVEADIVLYLGLCNGAGWAVKILDSQFVLLGIEKIMELGWFEKEKMTALILHELGHIYHKQYGLWYEKTYSLPEQFLWQLFTEGIAMVFEQEIVGNPDFYQQDISGWKQWCDSHFELIRDSFNRDRYTMNHKNQRYFGDWTRFEGYGDTGYYLGTKFIRYLMKNETFDNLILFDIEKIKESFERFMTACNLFFT